LRIYTKTGDGGETGLVGGARISKDSARIAAIGAIDELNAGLGVARCEAFGSFLEEEIAKIQNWLFQLGAEVATPPGSKFKNDSISEKEVAYLEESMDSQNEQLPALKNFILPGGCELAAQLHLARCVCRRAERELLFLHRSEPIRDVSRKFLNRLSDWIFLASRTANRLAGVKDIIWTPRED